MYSVYLPQENMKIEVQPMRKPAHLILCANHFFFSFLFLNPISNGLFLNVCMQAKRTLVLNFFFSSPQRDILY